MDFKEKTPDSFVLLKECIQQYHKVRIAFSGGIDSTLLAFAALQALTPENVRICHLTSVLQAQNVLVRVKKLAKQLGINQNHLEIIEIFPLTWNEFIKNDDQRCYFCKKEMYTTIRKLDRNSTFTILDGTHVDDLKYDRPGFRAVRELNIKTPYLECEMGKDMIRKYAEKFELPNSNLPSDSCLATRLERHHKIGAQQLVIIEKLERIIHGMGCSDCRVRPRDTTVVLELGQDDIARVRQRSNIRLLQQHIAAFGFEKIAVQIHQKR